MSTRIFIQQDSAKSHICEDNKEINDALMEQNINAVLYIQTLNSPDINLLDLGSFGAILSFNNVAPRNE